MQISTAVEQALDRLSTETKERTMPKSIQTPIKPKFAEVWAQWLRIELCGDPELEKMAVACGEWCKAFSSRLEPRWLCLIGICGTGKTHCAKRIWDWAEQKRDWSRTDYIGDVVYWPDFVQKLRAGNAFSMRDDMKRWPVLVLDDISSSSETEFSFDELNTLLGCRAGKWTIITSNISLPELAQKDTRVVSRIVRSENIVVQVETTDY